jgi:hypothetical protein
MDSSADKIHQALEAVNVARRHHQSVPELGYASVEIKRFQARRFRATYADLLASSRYKAAARFFLEELYSDRDYSARDEQFARIASTLARLFPQSVVDTAGALAQVHALTERLDDLMALQWLAGGPVSATSESCALYIRCWRSVADHADRQKQLQTVLELGEQLDRLTRKPGLRTLLKMMRGPAAAAGLSSLQAFLEAGFDAFAGMHGATEFLGTVRDRESAWLDSLFNDETVTCETKLTGLMDSVPAVEAQH